MVNFSVTLMFMLFLLLKKYMLFVHFRHPLFPLMALLFERCEQVTQSPDCPLVANLKSDIQAFVQHHQQHLVDMESCLGKQPEVDSLVRAVSFSNAFSNLSDKKK